MIARIWSKIANNKHDSFPLVEIQADHPHEWLITKCCKQWHIPTHCGVDGHTRKAVRPYCLELQLKSFAADFVFRTPDFSIHRSSSHQRGCITVQLLTASLLPSVFLFSCRLGQWPWCDLLLVSLIKIIWYPSFCWYTFVYDWNLRFLYLVSA